jgi:hypothetical protein
MTRRLAAAALAATMVLALGACSKSSDSNTNTTGAPATTAKPSSDTKADKTDKTEKPDKGDTDTTKKSSATTAKKSTGTSSGSSSKGVDSVDLTADEKQCFTDAATKLATTNPELAQSFQGADLSTLTAEQAGVIGGLIANCVPKAKIADALVSGIADETKLSSSEQTCVRDQIISLDTDELAVFVGLIIFGAANSDMSAVAPAVSKINSACNTNIPA